MSAFTVTWPGSGDFTPTPADFAALDAKLSKTINGAKGGAWAPTSPIVIGPSGYPLSANVPTTVHRNGRVRTLSGARFKLLGSAWPTYGTTRTRSLPTSFAGASANPWDAAFFRVPGDLGFQLKAPSFVDASGLSSLGSIFLPLRFHAGATISQATITWRVGVPHGPYPGTAPRARIVRVDLGGTPTPMTSTDLGADDDGFVTYVDADATDIGGRTYYNTGRPKTWVIPVDQNNVVDRATDSVFLQVIEESPHVHDGAVLSRVAYDVWVADGGIDVAPFTLPTTHPELEAVARSQASGNVWHHVDLLHSAVSDQRWQ